MEGSNAASLDAMLALGMRGSIHTRDVADDGPELEIGGRAAPAAFAAQTAMPGPEPTVSVTVGVVPSESPATGTGLWVEMSAATGSTPMNTRATARATGTRQARRPAPRAA